MIGGWLPGEGRRSGEIGALLLGYHEKGEFRFAGKVGTGFGEKELKMLGRVLAPDGYRSATVTCLTMPSGHTGSAVTSALKQRGFTIASGYGALKDATIRIGHMGDHTVEELNVLLAELEQVLGA